MGVSPKYAILFGAPYSQDYNVLESKFGSPNFGKIPYGAWGAQGLGSRRNTFRSRQHDRDLRYGDFLRLGVPFWGSP